MPNMKSIWLETKSYKVIKLISAGKASWDHFLSSEAPLVIEKTSRHREYLLSLERPLIIRSIPLIIRKASCHREYLLSSEVLLIIGKTSRVPLIIGETSSCSTSCCRWSFLSDRERHIYFLNVDFEYVF